jgi:hypothetical protein
MSLDRIKQEVWEAALLVAHGRVNQALNRMDSLRESLGSEGKSSAGDKHETGRAMVQMEMERAVNDWKLAQALEADLRRRAPAEGPPARWGSWVQTDSGHVLIAAPLGAITTPHGKVHVISAASPLAQALLVPGAMLGDEVHFNGRTQKVLMIR